MSTEQHGQAPDGRIPEDLEGIAIDTQLSMLTRGQQWYYPEGLRTPRVDEVRAGIAKMIKHISDKPLGTGIQVGILYIVKLEEGKYDVFTYTGTVTD